MTDEIVSVTGHTLQMIREEIEAPLRAEIERLKAELGAKKMRRVLDDSVIKKLEARNERLTTSHERLKTAYGTLVNDYAKLEIENERLHEQVNAL